MDPLSVLQIAGSAATAAKAAWSVGEALYTFCHDVKVIDQTVGGLIAEIKALSSACTLVDERLRDIVQNFDHEITRPSESRAKLWACVEAQVIDSQKSVDQLQAAVAGLVKDGSNAFAQAWRLVKLNMQTKDIGEARNRIRSHTASLQTILQTVAIEICYLAPKKADQQLRLLLSRTEECMEQLKALRLERADSATKVRASEDDVLALSQGITVDGESLYSKSEASGSLLGGDDPISGRRGINVAEWMQDISAIDAIISRSTSVVRRSSMTSPSLNGDVAPSTERPLSTAAPNHNGNGMTKIAEDDGSDDEMTIELALEALSTGRSLFDAGDHQEASSYLRETLKIVRELPAKRQKICDTWEVRFMLSVCAYHTLEFAEAEASLTSVIDDSSQLVERSDEQLLQVCEAGHLLSQVCVKLNKLDHARLYCENALQGRRRLLGKNNGAYHASVALMARVYELQGSDYRAKIYIKTIPEAERDSLESMFKDLVVLESQPIVMQSNVSIAQSDSSDGRSDVHRLSNRGTPSIASGRGPQVTVPEGRKRSFYNPATWRRPKQREVGLPQTPGASPAELSTTQGQPQRAESVVSVTTSLSSRLSDQSSSTLRGRQYAESVSSISEVPLTQNGLSPAGSAVGGYDPRPQPGRFDRRRSGADALSSTPTPTDLPGAYRRMSDASSFRKVDLQYFESKAMTAGCMRMKTSIIDGIKEGAYSRAEVDHMLAERARAIRNTSLTAVLVADQQESMAQDSKRDNSIVQLHTNYGQINIALRGDIDGLDDAKQSMIMESWTAAVIKCHSGLYDGCQLRRQRMDQWSAYGAFGASTGTNHLGPIDLLEILPELASVHFNHQHVGNIVRGGAVAMLILQKRSGISTSMGDAMIQKCTATVDPRLMQQAKS
ncbi:hypothetical protein DOTSEDRAFT_48990 [Dothistroma septosporum NZE10]|uniref:Fungal N-terminal domain-containing protein n=1 Tax=Dothistroma septosporum (strain NZE10 / CBS 128990) TaxID=675120 RepID=N1PYE0_DOTSN|nr:hypothetical protein DOTSEDRAFT_48990 [Dothistroma septosporum NZE10]